MVEAILKGRKCLNNILEFAKYFYIADEHGKYPIILSDYQSKLLNDWAHNYGKEKDVILSADRFTGKTTLMTIFILWYILFNHDKVIGVITNEQEHADVILSKIKFTYDNLPDWLKPDIISSDNELCFSNNTKILAVSDVSALKGRTIDLLYIDELASFEQTKALELVCSMFPMLSINTTRRIFVVSTPNDDKVFSSLWDKANTEKSSFKPYELIKTIRKSKNDEN